MVLGERGNKEGVTGLLPSAAAGHAHGQGGGVVKAGLGGARSGAAGGMGNAAARHKLGLVGLGGTSSSAANPLQPRGNPTGGGGGALGNMTTTSAFGRPAVNVFGQRNAAGPPVPAPRHTSNLLSRAAGVNVASRRPFIGKQVHADVVVPPPEAAAVTVAANIESQKPIVIVPASAALVVVLEDVAMDFEETTEAMDSLDRNVKSLEPLMGSLAIRNIDSNDTSPLLVPEYINDITDYLFRLEKKFDLKEKYLDGTQLNGRMRAVLLDWLIQVHLQFGLKAETFYIATSAMDRYLQVERNIPRQHLQLVGVTATYIAVKYEEITVPCIQDFSAVSDGAFTTKELLQMEAKMLKTLQFDMSPPIPAFFLRRCSKAWSADITMHQLAKYIVELAMLDYSSCHIRPSLLAASSLALSLMIVNKKSLALLWNPTVQHYSRYKIQDMKQTIRLLANVLAAAYDETGKLQAVRKKYSGSKMYRVSVLDFVNPSCWKSWFNLQMAQV